MREAGTSVSLYGYSLPLLSDLPDTSGQLASSLGPFALATVLVALGIGFTAGFAALQALQQ